MLLNNNDVVLFQGDSITDWGRNREDGASLGVGYSLMVASRVGHLYPEKNITFLNRGIGGNRTIDLQKRWDKDCLELKPNVLSIMIGINDTWRRFDNNENTPVEQYEARYRDLLQRATDKLDVKLVMMEPFVLPVPEDRKLWRADLDPKIHVVRELAREFGAVLVPLDGLFAEASTKADPAFWTPDGVHPSPAGHGLIAEAWLKAVGAI
ncbi:lysophospholipase L1-like esterase [Fontibacillus solani]|uniref:Lysophospholipase L1-like esterase n=1 Tax=Fontibacillus solani TaxID=1572857 RepID=A0A7W3XQ88_9BACL|nr:SGNH/GDSL hydrolase family protein [Fontibacillus solani]MBA9084200.1 lysophospholipase L1-like esterase [Fontibacillus solani]